MIDQPRPASSADPLAQHTRARLFALLGELARPAGTVELAEHLGLHHNGVRLHLERLEQAGLLVRASQPQARGRPRDIWRIAPDAHPGGHAPRAYTDLARWLARAAGSRDHSLRGVEATGREIGQQLASHQDAAREDSFETALTALGFRPRLQSRQNEHLTFCVGNCPYRDAVRENQPVVCAMHKGITRGLVDMLRQHATLAEFLPHDPDEAGCVIKLSPTPRASDTRRGEANSSVASDRYEPTPKVWQPGQEERDARSVDSTSNRGR